MNTSEANCKKIEPLLDAFVDSELEPPLVKEVESHLSSCSACQDKLASIQKVIASLKALPKIGPTRDLSQDLEKLIAAKKKKKVLPLKRIFVLSACAALVLLMILAIFLQTNNAPETALNKNQAKPNVIAVIPSGKNIIAESQTAQSNLQTTEEDQSQKELNPRGNLSPTIAQKSPNQLPPKLKPTNIESPSDNKPPETPNTNDSNSSKVNSKFALQDEELEIATLNERDNTANQIGIATDEDGLYAIKLQ
jgi:anti-sigma factor RsiW